MSDAPLVEADVEGPTLAASTSNVGVSKSRWWMLFVFCYLNLLQGWFWVLPGPIAAPYNDILGLDGDAVELLLNLGQILFVVGSLPYALLMGRGRHRLGMLSACALILSGSVCRYAARDGSAVSQSLMYASASANAIAGIVAMGAVSTLAETWFPVNERATATAIMGESNIIGCNVGYLLGPYMVPDSSDPNRLYRYHLVCLLASAPLTACALLHFPDAPTLAPSDSAALQREGEAAFTLAAFWATLKALSASRSFWALSLAYGAVAGVFGCWQSILDLLLSGYDEVTLGWLSAASSFAGSLAGIAVGRLLDRLRWHKALGVAMFAGSAVCIGAFWALTSPGMQSSGSVAVEVALFGVTMLAGILVNASLPVFYELLMEATFPVPDAVVLLMALNIQNIIPIPFLAIPAGPWMTPFLAAAIAASAALVAFGYRATNARYDYDVKGIGGGRSGDEEEQLVMGEHLLADSG